MYFYTVDNDLVLCVRVCWWTVLFLSCNRVAPEWPRVLVKLCGGVRGLAVPAATDVAYLYSFSLPSGLLSNPPPYLILFPLPFLLLSPALAPPPSASRDYFCLPPKWN